MEVTHSYSDLKGLLARAPMLETNRGEVRQRRKNGKAGRRKRQPYRTLRTKYLSGQGHVLPTKIVWGTDWKCSLNTGLERCLPLISTATPILTEFQLAHLPSPLLGIYLAFAPLVARLQLYPVYHEPYPGPGQTRMRYDSWGSWFRLGSELNKSQGGLLACSPDFGVMRLLS